MKVSMSNSVREEVKFFCLFFFFNLCVCVCVLLLLLLLLYDFAVIQWLNS